MEIVNFHLFSHGKQSSALIKQRYTLHRLIDYYIRGDGTIFISCRKYEYSFYKL